MRSSSKRFVSIVLALAMLVAAVFVYSTFIRSAYSDVETLRAQANSKTTTFTQQQSSVKQIQNLLSQYQDVLKVEDTISSMLPLSPDIGSDINQITGLAQINNLTLDILSTEEMAIKPSKQPTLAKGIGTLKFNFHLTGGYENFKNFIQELETNITLIDLVNLKVEPFSKGKSAGNIFSYTITANAYYQTQ